MADMVFKYSTINSGKTINILQTADSYEKNKFQVVLIKSIKDTKSKNKVLSSNGMERQADIVLREDESLLKDKNYKLYYTAKVILVDEVELLNEEQVKELWMIAHLINIPVICYGLRSNFKGEIFSQAVSQIFALADSVEEIGSSSLCSCGKKAIFNARKVNDEYMVDGPTIVIDDKKSKNVEYVPLCSDCYLKYVKIHSEEAEKLAKLVDKIR